MANQRTLLVLFAFFASVSSAVPEPSLIRANTIPTRAPEILMAEFKRENEGISKVEIHWKLPPRESWNGAIKMFKVVFWRVPTNESTSPLSKHDFHERAQYTIKTNDGNTTSALIFGPYRCFTYAVKMRICNKQGCGPTGKWRILPSNCQQQKHSSETVTTFTRTTEFCPTSLQVVKNAEATTKRSQTRTNYVVVVGGSLAALVMLALAAAYASNKYHKKRRYRPRVALEDVTVIDPLCRSKYTSTSDLSSDDLTGRCVVLDGIRRPLYPAAETSPSRGAIEDTNRNPNRELSIRESVRHCTPPQLRASEFVDHRGGSVVIPDTGGVGLHIPPGALPEGRGQLIHISIVTDAEGSPILAPNQFMLTPVVDCGPDGLEFERPVRITTPHAAVFGDDNKWKTGAKYSEDAETWYTLLDPDGQEGSFGDSICYFEGGMCHLMVTHFTWFSIVGHAKEMHAEINMWVLVYFTPPAVDTDCTVRVYVIPAEESSLKMVQTLFEPGVNGRTSDTPKLLRFDCSGGSVRINLTDVCSGWESVNGTQEEISFADMKNGHVACPNVTFKFKRDSPDACNFSCTAEVVQMAREAQARVLDGSPVRVDVTTRSNEGSSSGYHSMGPDYKIPLRQRKKLCLLLDPKERFLNDWRMLADEMNCPRENILFWDRGLRHDVSPTNELLEWWECGETERFPLEKMHQALLKLERADAAEVIEHCLQNVRPSSTSGAEQ